MENTETTTSEIMDFLKENLVPREEIEQIVSITVGASESRILQHVDRFAKLHETLDQELIILRSKYQQLEDRLEVVETKLGLAAAH